MTFLFSLKYFMIVIQNGKHIGLKTHLHTIIALVNIMELLKT
jgi:hypothetical protein